MSVLDPFVLVHYKVIRMGIEKLDGEVMATYDVQVLNADGQPKGTVHPVSMLTEPERTAIAAIFVRDVAEFEAETELTRWVEPEEPPE